MSHEKIHEHHVKHWHDDAQNPDREEFHESRFRDDTADSWRHARMYEPIRCLDHRKDLSFLTIGDGRFGLDSIRIRSIGFQNATPSDIGDALLKKAKEKGLIDHYLVENAEHLSLQNDSVDVVFCKESYHHMPRAPLALFEMLRVCRFATILIEPRDPTVGAIGYSFRQLVRHALLKLMPRLRLPALVLPSPGDLYGDGPAPAYETSGNYVYSISPREMEKAALGSNLPAVAFKGVNDFYVEGAELADRESDLFRTIKDTAEGLDRAFQKGTHTSSLLMAILFKQMPDDKTVARLTTAGFYVKKLPRNPYL